MRIHLRAKGLVGVNDVLKILFSISFMYNTKSDHFSLKIKPYIYIEIGNQIQNHKIEINSRLIYKDGSIWSTLIFNKIIGSDTLWFPLPPSEVLKYLYTIYLRRVAHTCIFTVHLGTTLIVLIRSLRQKSAYCCYIVFISNVTTLWRFIDQTHTDRVRTEYPWPQNSTCWL